MFAFHLSRVTFSLSATSALLSGCGGSQPPIGVTGAMIEG
jgi:hypothetical protein